jgi:hypothetical protein
MSALKATAGIPCLTMKVPDSDPRRTKRLRRRRRVEPETRVPPIDRGPPVKRWVTVIWGATAYYIIAFIGGGSCFVIGILALLGLKISGDPFPISGRLMFVFVGLCFVSISLVFALFTAHTVARFADGSFAFRGRVRTLEVQPGDLLHVSSFPFDRGRVLPLLVEARSGAVWLSPSLGEMGDFLEELADWNPLAVMDMSRRWWTTSLWSGLRAHEPRVGGIDDPIWAEPLASRDERPHR